MVADHDANRVKRPILSIIHNLSESDNFDEFFNRSKQTIREDGILFDEETFITSIRNGGHLNNNEAQFLLRRLAEVNLPPNVNIAGPSAVNIEHIYPQTPTRENGWITDNRPVLSNDEISRLGNLTLCDGQLNSSLGNRSWRHKSETWNDIPPDQIFSTTKGDSVNGPAINLMSEQWHLNEILERSARLGKLIFDLLILPVSQE